MASGTNKLGNNRGLTYSFLNRPVLIDCNFVVDSTNGNGFGVKSLKGAGVKHVWMATSASLTGTVATTANQITSIAGGTSSLVVGMPVAGTGIPAGTTITSIISSSAVGISKTPTGNHSSETITYVAVGNPMVNTGVSSASVGYALIQLENGYNRYCGGFSGFVSPSTGGTIAINSTSLTVGTPYIIASVGAGTAGTVTIAPVADVSGSLAGTYFTMPDGYGNQYVIWFSVSGVGAAPTGVSGTLVQQSISTNDTAATIGADLVITLENLLAAQPGNATAPASIYSYTATGTTTVTVVSTVAAPLPGGPADGATATGFTFAVTKDQTNLQNWQAVGLPAGVLPAVGVSFIATATGYSSRGGSTGTMIAVGTSAITSIEVIGDPNQSIGPIPMGGSPNVGALLLVQFLAPTPTTVDSVPLVLVGPIVPTAPANNTVVGLSFYMEAGSILIKGE